DGGSSWTGIRSGADDGLLYAVAIDPTSTNVLYAGGLGFSPGASLFKSIDGGGTWSRSGFGIVSPDLRAIAVDPVNPATVYVGTVGGAYKSTDGGTNWTRIDSGLTEPTVLSLKLDPLNAATLYAGTAGGGVFRNVFQEEPDFSLSFDLPAITVRPGTKTPVRVVVNRVGGLAGSITVTPPSPNMGVKPKPLAPLSTTGSSVTFKLKIGGEAPAGTYSLVFSGMDELGRQRSRTLTLTVQNQ